MENRFLKAVAKGAMLFGVLMLVVPFGAAADEADARSLVKGMADYVASLDAFRFDFDEYHEVVTPDGEKLGLAGSGTVAVMRPDKIRVDRKTGFTNVEFAFDGKVFSAHDKASALFVRQPLPGTLDQLIDTLRDDYGRPLPAADLLTGIGHSSLISGATEVKDLGAGIVSGAMCDHLAFRGEEVDWQLWIAQGDAPYPCMIIITSREVAQAPQYRVQVNDWRPGSVDVNFTPDTPANATKVEIAEYMAGAHRWPENFTLEVEK
ncbi:MAG: DUF2092 domain-containing protein [Ruegeria sp.]